MRPPYVSGEHRNIGGAGVAEAFADPSHFRIRAFECVDYGSAYDEVPRAPEPRRSRFSWRRVFGRRG